MLFRVCETFLQHLDLHSLTLDSYDYRRKMIVIYSLYNFGGKIKIVVGTIGVMLSNKMLLFWCYDTKTNIATFTVLGYGIIINIFR